MGSTSEGRKTMSKEQRITERLQKKSGTADEVQHELGFEHQSNSAAFTKLKQAGIIEGTGIYRKTRLGKMAEVMQISQPKNPLPFGDDE
jgi:predicted transcriptional regulator